jgi:hypothetical protein
MQQLLQNYARYIVPHRCVSQGTGTSNRLPLPSWASADNYNPPDPPLQLGSTNSANACDTRGRLVILPAWGDIPASFTYYYDNEPSVVDMTDADTTTPHGDQDYYGLNTTYDLNTKWSLAESFFNYVNASARNSYNGVFYYNHLSAVASLPSNGYPYFYASGQSSPGNGDPLLLTGLTTPGFNSYYPDFPRIGCFIGICSIAFEGMNQLAAEYLNSIPFADGNRFVKSASSTVGIVLADFPGKDLIAAIANVNNGINLQ